MAPPDDEVDNTLFPDPSAAAEADAIWQAGADENEKGKPQGAYNVTVVKAELGKSNSSGRLQIHYELKVETGDSAGITLHKYDGLGTAKQAAITQQQLARVGIDMRGMTMQKLPAVLASLVGSTIGVTGKTNGDFYNIYFNKAVDTAVGSDGNPDPNNWKTAAAGSNGKPGVVPGDDEPPF